MDEVYVKKALRAMKPENRMETIDGTDFEAATDIREGMSVGSYGLTDAGDDDTFGGKRKGRRTRRTRRRTRKNKKGGKRGNRMRKSKRGSRRLK